MKSATFDTTASGKTYPLHYKIWGEENPNTLVCVHGLTGNSQDFKFIGEVLSQKNYRVVAIDMAGRGESSYFENPDDYNFDQYLIDLNALLNIIGCNYPSSCDWLGVSMGGLLGFRLSGLDNSPINRLILSDIGPEVPQFDLNFISQILKLNPEYTHPTFAVPFLKMAIGTPYSRGPLDEHQWLYFAEIALKKREDGIYVKNFDPQIAQKFDTEPLGNQDLWGFWEKTYQPTLSLRGELSTLFPLRVLEQMILRKPNNKFKSETIIGAGHVPSLFTSDQIEIIEKWLMATSTP